MEAPPAPSSGRRRHKIPIRRKAAYLTILFVFLLAAAEFLARGYWALQGIPFWTCQREIQHIYYPAIPNFSPFMRKRGAKDEGVEVLLLGASTLYPNVGPISTMLMEQLTLRLHRHVEVVDLAVPAHTSLDSYYKYLELSDKAFDLVIVYDSINDLRANNCPPEVFRADYSHYQWYRELNAIEKGREGRILALPITLKLWAIRLEQRLGLGPRTIPENAPMGPWSQYGSEIKSASPFRRNLERILQIAKDRGEKAVLMSFATYIPADYSRAKFDALDLDYTVHWFPIEIWGPPANIAKGVAVQNEVIQTLAKSKKYDPLFVDEAGLIPQEGRYYNDICHLSTEGCAAFVDHLLPVVVPYLEKKLGPKGEAGAPLIPTVAESLRPLWSDRRTTEAAGATP